MADKNLEKVIAALKKGDKKKAQELLRPILQNSPSADAWYLAAHATTNTSQAEFFLKKALELDPFHEKSLQALQKPNHAKVSNAAVKTKSKSSKKSSRRSLWLLILTVFVCLGSMWILLSSMQSQISPSSSPTRVMPTLQNANLSITDNSNTGIPRAFLDLLSVELAPYGYITLYESEINRSGRLIADIEFNLWERGNQRQLAANTVERFLRVYRNFTQTETQAGGIYLLVSWQNRNRCASSAGMGFLTMNAIDWETASQQDIFRAIDKELYPDNAVSYEIIGWYDPVTGVGC